MSNTNEQQDEDNLGLGKDWHRLLDDLDKISSYYDEGNRILSFGSDIQLRTRLIEQGLPEKVNGRFVDVGCGPGTMSAIALSLRPETAGVLLDPLPSMLGEAAKKLGEEKCDYVCGIYEYLPFRSNGFVACLAGFTLRDARHRIEAYREIRRVLLENAPLIMADLGKPDSLIKRFFVASYWKFLAPLRLRLALGERGKPFADIYLTYRHLPKNSVLLADVEKNIGPTRFEKRMLDGVVLVTATKNAV
ncbi:MAG: class I SAM-dependent methyltransferase [Nitrososphaerota archaeon]|nr:class I SAM-dependent methyltransferase [Nitrososphaerota archaeon]